MTQDLATVPLRSFYNIKVLSLEFRVGTMSFGTAVQGSDTTMLKVGGMLATKEF
jgi:hypothetical protein